jgi:hypothetical protein
VAIEVIKSRFTKTGQEGDFAWMIEQPRYSRTLFLFNDNEGEFYAHLNGGPHTCGIGGGNAVIRPYQCKATPRAVGIPTGTYASGPHYGGYTRLDDHVRSVLDDSFGQIGRLLASGNYDAIAFSWDDATKFGGHIFKTAQEVRDEIVARILAVASQH